jgi:hypothetical protein|tara:strand:- start:663 stop:854 length:192 start_codon:yes stop_codon:yes gene_type:complete
MKVFTGQRARAKANSYHHQDGRLFTHVFIEIHDKDSKYRIYAVVHENMMKSIFESELEITVLD